MPHMPRLTVWNRAEVRALAAEQHQLITAAQLAALRVPRSTVARADELGGMFSFVLPGVHRVDGRGPLGPDQRDMAALLYAGEGSMLTGAGLLRRSGVRTASRTALAPNDHVHVLIAHEEKRVSRGFVQVERTVALPRPRLLAAGVRAAPLARAVLDAVRRCADQGTVRAVIFEVVQRGLVAPESLEDERRLGQKRGSRYARLALEEVFAGVRSVPEADLRAAFVRRGVDWVLYNPRLHLPDGTFLASPDVYDPVTGVCLEVDSREHHFAVSSWEATMRRHARMTARGLAVLHAPPSRISTAPDPVVEEFLGAVDVRAGWPAPQVVVRPARATGAGTAA